LPCSRFGLIADASNVVAALFEGSMVKERSRWRYERNRRMAG
jgi:hypothetical protein